MLRNLALLLVLAAATPVYARAAKPGGEGGTMRTKPSTIKSSAHLASVRKAYCGLFRDAKCLEATQRPNDPKGAEAECLRAMGPETDASFKLPARVPIEWSQKCLKSITEKSGADCVAVSLTSAECQPPKS